MKKYAFLVVAVIMAMAASAFVIANKSNSDPETTYWFLMDESGTSVTTTQISDPASLCPDKLTEPDCARKYSESQTEINSEGVRVVKSSQVDSPLDFRSKNE
jgi:hypothetical protein